MSATPLPQPEALADISKRTCASCALAIKTESSSTGLRCGKDYFKKPMSVRKVEKLILYTEVHTQHKCEQWSQFLPGVLVEKHET